MMEFCSLKLHVDVRTLEEQQAEREKEVCDERGCSPWQHPGPC